MGTKRKRCKRYNTPGHAHELTFSCFKHNSYFLDELLCTIFLEELDRLRIELDYCVWAYVVMPTHIHLLVWPRQSTYNISRFLNRLKGRTAGYYREYLKQNNKEKYDHFLVTFRGEKSFRLWQRGGGFDRNLWNGKAIHDAITYIEANPVRANLVSTPEEWKWSSAFARAENEGVVPDIFTMPVQMVNPQKQRLGIV